MKKKLFTLILLAGVSITLAHIVNKVITRLSKNSGPINAFDEYFYDSFLGKVQFSKQGRGQSILLVHDIHPLSSSYFMQPLANALANHYTVYSLDLPGCGQSYSIDKTHTSFEYGTLIHKFIKDVIREETILFVNENASFSGILATSPLLHNNNLISQLYLINPTSFKDYGQKQSFLEIFLEYSLKIPVLGTSLYNIIFSKSNIKHNFLKKFFPNINLVHQWYLDASYQGAHLGENQGKELLISLLSHELNGNCANFLSEIKVPVHILHSNQHPLSTNIEYESVLPSIQSHFISDIDISIPINGYQQVLDILK